MRFGLVHRVLIDALATLGILALITSGKLHVGASAAVSLGLLIGIFLPDRYRQESYLRFFSILAPIGMLALQLGRLFVGGDPIPLVVEFAAALQVIRLITRRGAAHDSQVILLALLHLIAGTVLGGGLTYAVAILGFLIFTPGALVLSHLRREVEGNYRQGARDRTGMPVDVPRILRSRRVIGRGFLLFTCGLSLPVFLLAAFLFLLFPRVGFAWLSVPSIEPSRVVGFSNRVDLGGVGKIRTDPTLVMRVRPDDMGPSPAVRRNLYLRGAVFDTYDGKSWSRHPSRSGVLSIFQERVLIRRRPKHSDRKWLIDLEPIEPPVVFLPGSAIAFIVRTQNKNPLGRSLIQGNGRGQLEYETQNREGLQYEVFLPQKGRIVPERSSKFELGRYLSVPEGLSPRVRNLAEEIAPEAGTPLSIARGIEESLRTGYRYDLGSPSGAAADPLDHFLFESKRGHCEYYSTAMAMLLRLRGVPSRNVTGFVGGTYNRFGEFYAVRQGDAHSWVEAYLPDRGWIRFDPTPPASAAPQVRTQGFVSVLREILEAASQTWKQNVEGFDLKKQLSIVQAIKELLKSESSSEDPESKTRGPSGRRLLFAGLGAVLLVGGALYFWRFRRKDSKTGPQTPLPVQAAIAIELYRRLESALSVQGVPRPPATPPLLHAKTLESAGHPTGTEALSLTREYLEFRFGTRSLQESEIQRFRQRVAALRKLDATKQAA